MNKKEVADFLRNAELDIKIIIDNKIVSKFHTNFLEWLEHHQKAGNSPYVILFPKDADHLDERRVEITIKGAKKR